MLRKQIKFADKVSACADRVCRICEDPLTRERKPIDPVIRSLVRQELLDMLIKYTRELSSLLKS